MDGSRRDARMSRQTRRFSRRRVLRGLAGAGLAPLVLSAKAPAAADPLATFDHIVVLMLENRSFDNLLGYLYQPGTVPRGQHFEGVAGKNLSNPIPAGADQASRGVVAVAPGTVPEAPNPDPGEGYPHVNAELYGAFIPPANRDKDAQAMMAPYNAPTPLPAVAPMDGFVTDYIAQLARVNGREPTYAEYRQIMDCFPAGYLPTLTALAKDFAVCDHWYCAVPSQTFCNRSFFHAASSSGLVLNAPYVHWVTANTAETIFDRIDAAKDPALTWKVYYDPQDIYSLTALIHFQRLQHALTTNFFPMDRFLEDARSGQLPSYCFIEPRLLINHNDMHPPTNVLPGDALIHQVYEAIRTAASPTGSNWRNTLLVITFDEHGGCYDHVPPPAAVPPDPGAPPREMGFRFDRLGVRVPTILVSAYVEPGTVVSTPLDHATMLKTIETKWGLAPLTGRDRAARDLGFALTRTGPRPVAEWPVTTPPATDAAASNLDQPPNGLQRDVVGLAMAAAGQRGAVAEGMTVRDAVRAMERVRTPR